MKRLILFMIAMATFAGCTKKLTSRELGAYNYKTSAVSYSNGTLLVTAWGKGLSPEESEINALKTAVNDVIFKGVLDGNRNATQPPIINTVNAETKYKVLTDKLFDTQNLYKTYATVYTTPRSRNYRIKERKLDNILNMTVEYQIEINRAGLIKFIQENPINN